MSQTASRHDEEGEVGTEAAADFLGATVAYVLELIEVGALAARPVGDTRVIRVEDLEAFAAEQARRRPFMEELGRIGSEQMDVEHRRGLI